MDPSHPGGSRNTPLVATEIREKCQLDGPLGSHADVTFTLLYFNLLSSIQGYNNGDVPV